MSSNSPNPPPPSYQVGAGAPVNQQYLQSQGPPHGSGVPQQQQHYPSPPRQPQHQQHLPQEQPDSYAPLPAPQRDTGAPDIYTQDSQKDRPPSPYVMPSSFEQQGHASQQYYPPPPPPESISSKPLRKPSPLDYRPSPQQEGNHAQQPEQTLQQYSSPPYQDCGSPQPSAQGSQQYYPPQEEGGRIQPPGQASQQYYPPPSQQHAPGEYNNAVNPPQPPRPDKPISGQAPPQYQSGALTTTASGGYPVPPRRQSAQFGDDDPSSPIHYTRDPHKLVAYLVPFPKPVIKGVAADAIPDRFLIYTPPPPPLSKPQEGEKEDKLHKVQRKWQEEVRAAKTSDAKTASWKGVKGKATKGISYVMSKTTTSNLDFVNRIPGAKSGAKDSHADDGVSEGDTTHKTVGLEEIVLVYPSSYGANPDQVRTEFINTMMRTKSKAQRDAVIATGLLPVSAAIDIMATLIWPFGGLLEIDSVWAYSSIRGAKTARSVTKRLSSSTNSDPHDETEEQEMQADKLRMTFTQSPRIEVLYKYLVTRCRDHDHKHFPTIEVAPTETEVLQAIGWAPSQTGSVNKNWEDEAWETQEVKDDMKSTLDKAAKEWDKWCLAFAKSPEKAMKN